METYYRTRRHSLPLSARNFSDEKSETASVLTLVHEARKIGAASRQRKIQNALVSVSPPLLFILAALFIASTCIYARRNQGTYGCDAGDNVWILNVGSGRKHSIWNFQYPLEVTLAWGNLSLTAAKAVDIVWDLVAGRGYQGLAAIVVYKVFRVVIADSVKTRHLAHGEALALQYSSTSLTSLWTYFKACRRQRRTKSRDCSARFVCLSISVIYVLWSPTWIAAMTGYRARTEPFLDIPGDNKVSFDELDRCKILIVDGDRPELRLGKNYCVRPGTPLADAMWNYTQSQGCQSCYPHAAESRYYVTDNVRGDISKFVVEYINFKDRVDCNVSTKLEYPSGKWTTLDWVLDLKIGAYQYNHIVYPGNELLQNGTCVPREGYEWGYSVVLTIGFIFTTICFSVMWTQLLLTYRDRTTPQEVDMIFDDLRTTLVVARSIRDIKDGLDFLNNKELREALQEVDARVKCEHVGAAFRAKPDSEAFIDDNVITSAAHPLEIPIHTEAYRAYIRDGYQSLSRRGVTEPNRCYLPR